MIAATLSLPPNAPYDVEVGHEVEISVFLHPEEENTLVAEVEMDGDKIGVKAALPEGDLDRTLEIDTLVQSVAQFVWVELLGTPVFRDEDEEWVGRVSARETWAEMPRTPTEGYVTPESVPSQPEPEPKPQVESQWPARDEVLAHLGDVDVADIKMTGEELMALTRGEVPESLMERVLEARTTENLLDSAIESLQGANADGFPISRVLIELHEVRRRFGDAS
jgi:hypothetical protein